MLAKGLREPRGSFRSSLTTNQKKRRSLAHPGWMGETEGEAEEDLGRDVDEGPPPRDGDGMWNVVKGDRAGYVAACQKRLLPETRCQPTPRTSICRMTTVSYSKGGPHTSASLQAFYLPIERVLMRSA